MIKIHEATAKAMLKEYNQRVSAEATKELINTFGVLGEEISKNASNVLKHSGRKTLNLEDLRLTLQMMGLQ